MSSCLVVKLGGSAITDKSKICTPRLGLIHRVAGEIASYSGEIVVLHGGGSYAHPFATRKLMARGFKGASGLKNVSEIELNLDELTRIIGVALLLHGRSFVPLRPMSFLTLHNGNIGETFLGPLKAALQLGITPIIHGDLAMDDVKGVGVVSADRIASLLGQKLTVTRVLFGCDVDGVYEDTASKKVIREVNETNNSSSILKGVGRADGDATGGMRGKVIEALRLARLGVESYIFNLNVSGNLTHLLRGDSFVGTRFAAWKKGPNRT
jgi:isopentenyl phosphate kinase